MTTIIDKTDRPIVYQLNDDEPPPKGIRVFSGEDSYVVSREFIDYAYWHYQKEDAVRRLEYSNADLAR
jgi:hypothetical protein